MSDHHEAPSPAEKKRSKSRLSAGILPDSGRIQSKSSSSEVTASFRSAIVGMSPATGPLGSTSRFSSKQASYHHSGSSFLMSSSSSGDDVYLKETVDVVHEKKEEQQPKQKAFALQKQLFTSSSSLFDTPVGPKPPVIKSSPGKIIVPSNWQAPVLTTVPNYYPMERSNRILSVHQGHTLDTITHRLSSAFRIMSVQAKYVNKPASAALLTPEHVEIWLCLWKAPNGDIRVEVQRRRGDSVTFHRYGRHMLEAAGGDFCPDDFRIHSPSIAYLKNVEKMIVTELGNVEDRENESYMAIELALDMLTRDRLDARLLGIESLALLTDSQRTRLDTCRLASRAVLFGSMEEQVPAFDKIHEMLLCIIQKRSMGNDEDLIGAMVLDYDSDDEDFFEDEEMENKELPPEYNDTMTLMVHHAMTVVANAWEVVTTLDDEPEKTSDGLLVDAFLQKAWKCTEDDMLFSLLNHVRRADIKPHNACGASKTLRIICQSSTAARERVRHLGGPSLVSDAVAIGSSTHASLESEAKRLSAVLLQ